MIRTATRDDIPALLALINELAVFENEPDAVLTDEPMLTEAIFGDSPVAFAHVAEHDGRVVGCAVWYLTFSTWTGRHGIHLEDLVVTASARGGGHGRALIAELAQLCQSRGYPRLEWTVLDWNSPAIAFYQSLGAEHLAEWQLNRLTGDALSNLAATVG